MDLVEGILVFVAAVEAGSFSGATTPLGISPKLASKHMAELEGRLGAQLLHRTTRRLANLLDEMTSDLRETGKGLSGVLRVSTPITCGGLFVQRMLRRFRIPHSDLEMDLRLSDRFVDLAAQGIDKPFASVGWTIPA